MNALILTSGGLIAARVLSAWLSTGNSVAALWIGSATPRHLVRRERALGIAAPSWSISGIARRYNIPVRRNPRLSTWTKAGTAIQRLGADVLITVATYQILPENILSLFPSRAVNFHGAILPHYRGPHPLVGMILDGKADLYGGITLHCLSRGIDKGDIIGVREISYDPARGFIPWEVCLARAAGSLVQSELQSYLRGSLRARAQPPNAGNYRKVREEELTLSDKHSASRTKWLCEQFGASGRLRFRSQRAKRYFVSHFVRQVGPRTLKNEQVKKLTIEFDAADARVRVGRHRSWTPLLRDFMYWLAIAGHAVLPKLRGSITRQRWPLAQLERPPH
jgi:methionyl-tRNA formyltransferase